METNWMISFSYKKFLGGFDGEFRYSDGIKGEVHYISGDGQVPSQEQAIATVREYLRSNKVDIEILNISKIE